MFLKARTMWIIQYCSFMHQLIRYKQYFIIKPKAVYLWGVKYQTPWNQGIDFQLAIYLVFYSWQLWYTKDIKNISPSMKMGDLCWAMMYGQRWWDLLRYVVGCVVEMKAVIRSVIMRRPTSVLSVAYKKIVSAEISSLTQGGIGIAEKVVFLSFFLSFFEFSNYTYINEPRHGIPCLCHLRTTKTQTSLRIGAVWSAPLLFAAKTEWYL